MNTETLRADRGQPPVRLLPTLPGALLRTLGTALSPAAEKRSKLLILIFHRVLASADPLLQGTLQQATFDWQIATLKQHFNVLPLTEAATRLAAGQLPARAACVTFDDGYADNYEVALPILQKWGVPACFFISTGFLDGGRMWNDTIIETVRRARGPMLELGHLGLGAYPLASMADRRTAMEALLNQLKYLPMAERLIKVAQIAEHAGEPLPDNLMMSSEQVRGLQRAGMEVGAHTVGHPILTRLDPATASAEILASRARLEDITGQAITSFAYPNGRPGVDYARCHVDAVRAAGFKVAVSTAWGCARAGQDLMQLPRIGTWDPSPLRFNLRLLSTYASPPALTV